MIEIKIKAMEDNVLDEFTKRNCTMNEVAIALLRLKQIEQQLIDIDFENDIDITEE